MSQTLAAAGQRRSSTTPRHTPARGPARPPRPTLRVVRPPATERGRAVFAVGCLLLLVSGLLGLLLINTALAQGSFTLHDLQSTSDELGDREQALRQDIDVQAAPARLAARAKALGMVPSDTAAFLRLSDGKLLGVAHPATKPPTPTVTATVRQPAQQQKPTKQGNATATTTKTR
jgi:hypothetical protein